MSISLKTFEGIIDFKGQHDALLLFRVLTIVSAIVSFSIGFYRQSLQELWFIFAGCVGLTLFLTLLPWPYINKTKINWLPSNETNDKKVKEDEDEDEDEDEEEE
ncbi:SPC12-domain-containing protein [Neoconidiobolus thromboides FSU 785]|nr:SPC12-domain-containing protein [Neoconidiobolus thromboides FSU 785]